MLDKMHSSRTFFKNWWISLVIGILGIATGICCFAVPNGSLAVLTSFFIAVLIVGGIFNIAWALTNRRYNGSWGWSLARGILEILFGLWLIMLPLPMVTTMLIYVFGFWMLFHSIMGICESGSLAEFNVSGWGWLLACNILSLICSFIFLTTPVYGGIFVLTYVGLSFVLYGIFRIAIAFEWRKINREIRNAEKEFEDAGIID